MSKESMFENYEPEELEKFSNLAAHWWDPSGELATLHQMNPLRVDFLLNKTSLTHKKLLDIGCGGGIFTEAIATLKIENIDITGIDLSRPLIDVAKLHQLETNSNVEYLCLSAETFAKERSHYYDVVTCFELLEHVPDPFSLLKASSELLKPGGEIILSTINRSPKAYLFAILGAEYILKLLPKNTHDYSKFIKPKEIKDWLKQCGVKITDLKGISFNPLTKEFKITDDISVNYLLYATNS